MRVPTNLPKIRGDRTLREISRASGISNGDLSRIERGHQLPLDKWIPTLERAYGSPRHEWWPAEVLLVIAGDDA